MTNTPTPQKEMEKRCAITNQLNCDCKLCTGEATVTFNFPKPDSRRVEERKAVAILIDEIDGVLANKLDEQSYMEVYPKLSRLQNIHFRSLQSQLTSLEADLQAMKTRNTEGIEKMYSKMCKLKTPKRGELHLLLISLFS